MSETDFMARALEAARRIIDRHAKGLGTGGADPLVVARAILISAEWEAMNRRADKGLDPATVEACARVVDEVANNKIRYGDYTSFIAGEIAARIRSQEGPLDGALVAEGGDVSDLVKELRKHWQEITESDGGECGEMRMFREAADRIEEMEKAMREIVAEIDGATSKQGPPVTMTLGLLERIGELVLQRANIRKRLAALVAKERT